MDIIIMKSPFAIVLSFYFQSKIFYIAGELQYAFKKILLKG